MRAAIIMSALYTMASTVPGTQKILQKKKKSVELQNECINDLDDYQIQGRNSTNVSFFHPALFPLLYGSVSWWWMEMEGLEQSNGSIFNTVILSF